MLLDKLANLRNRKAEFAGEIADLIFFVSGHAVAIPKIPFGVVVGHCFSSSWFGISLCSLQLI